MKLYRWLPTLSLLVVGAASFALSYVALRDVAAWYGAVPEHMAWLMPVVIDGGIIAGSVIVWAQSMQDERRQVFPFLFVAFLVAVSVVGNATHAEANALARFMAALPPVVLLGSLELVAAQHRRSVRIAAAEQGQEGRRDGRLGTPAAEADERGRAGALGGAQTPTRLPAPTAPTRVAADGAAGLPQAPPQTRNGQHPVGVRTAASDEVPAAAARTNGGATGNGSTVDGQTTPHPPHKPPSDVAHTPAAGKKHVRSTPAELGGTAEVAGVRLADPPEGASTREAIEALVDGFVAAGGDINNPKLGRALIGQLDSSPSYTREVLRELRAGADVNGHR